MAQQNTYTIITTESWSRADFHTLFLFLLFAVLFSVCSTWTFLRLLFTCEHLMIAIIKINAKRNEEEKKCKEINRLKNDLLQIVNLSFWRSGLFPSRWKVTQLIAQLYRTDYVIGTLPIVNGLISSCLSLLRCSFEYVCFEWRFHLIDVPIKLFSFRWCRLLMRCRLLYLWHGNQLSIIYYSEFIFKKMHILLDDWANTLHAILHCDRRYFDITQMNRAYEMNMLERNQSNRIQSPLSINLH